MLKQKTKYGCGLYAVANAIHNESFATEERLEASKKGNTVGQLSKWLQDDGSNFCLDALYFNLFGGKLPKEALTFVPKGDITTFPVILNVSLRDGGRGHLIGANINKEGIVELFDSLKNCLLYTSPSPRDQRGSRMPSSA